MKTKVFRIFSSTMLVILMMCLLLTFSLSVIETKGAVASGVCGEDLIWELSGSESGYTLTIQGTGDMYTYIEPDQEYDSEPDYAPWYPYRDNITEIILENGITSIGGGAFYACKNFTHIDIPQSVTLIDYYAFMACKGLVDIDIPDSVTKIGESAFDSCTALETVCLSNSLTEIDRNVFSACKSLISVDLPEGIKQIKKGVFSGCESLRTIDLPNSLENLDGLVFAHCSNLEYLIIPENVSTIGWAFCSNCYSLNSIVLPRSLASIGDGFSDKAFTNCKQLTIYGYLGSFAQTYAEKYNIPFESLEGIAVTEIQLDTLSAIMANETTLQLNATVLPEEAENKGVIWSSKNSSIADVDQYGLVEAKTYGKTTITARSDADSSIKAICRIQTRYYDVLDQSQYYFKPVYWAADKNYVAGFNGGAYFGPDQGCTRKQMAIILWRMAGQPKASGSIPFTDVNYSKNSASNRAILWAYRTGVIGGYKDGTFRPDNLVTRKQAMLMLYRFAGAPEVYGLVDFSDVGGNLESASYKAILWGTQNGITGGSNGMFKPNNSCLRKQIVTFLYKYAK